MTKSLARRNIAGPKSIARRQIAASTGRHVDVIGIVDQTTGSGSIQAAADCEALIYLMGPGASGVAGGGSGSGGSGGAALFKRQSLAKGQSISWALGTPGASAIGATDGNSATDSTATMPDGRQLVAGGGKKGTLGATVPAPAGGIATGGDVNRNGGDGGAVTVNVGATGGAGGLGGGLGGAAAGSGGGGGAGAGFGDLGALGLLGGDGSAASGSGNTANGAAIGAGSGAATSGGTTSGTGGAPRIVILLVRTY